jgi:flagellar basal body P-ring formation protein FlgA
MQILQFFLMMSLLWLVSPLLARDLPPVTASDLADVAREYVAAELQPRYANLEVVVGRLDDRIRLNGCLLPLEPFMSAGRQLGPGNQVVGIRCPGEGGWSFHIQVRVVVKEPVVVAARALARGEVVTRAMVQVVEHDISSLGSGYFGALHEVEGMVVRNGLRSGLPLTPINLSPPLLVKKGEQVIITAISGQIEVRMEGESLEDGALGAIIKVRNRSSRQTVEAEVVAAGVVRVRF